MFYSISMFRFVEFFGIYRKVVGGGIKEFFFLKEKLKRIYRYERFEKFIKDVEEFLGKVELEIKVIEGRMNFLSIEIERIKE